MKKSKNKYVLLAKTKRKFSDGGTMTPEEQMYMQKMQANQANQQIDSASSQVPVYGQYYQLAKMGEGMGKSFIPKDQYGNAKGGGGKAANELFTPDHETMINDVSRGDYGAALFDSTGLGKFARAGSELFGQGNKKSGFWGEINKTAGATNPTGDIAKTTPTPIDNDPAHKPIPGGVKTNYMAEGGSIEMEKDEFLNEHKRLAKVLKSNNPKLLKAELRKQIAEVKEETGEQIHAMGGMQAYKMAEGGQANAEVEGGETMREPNGETQEFNGPSHEQGGIPTDLQAGTQIFSDRLKSATGKTFADESKKFDTSKYKKIMDDKKADALKKKTAELMFAKNNRELTKLFDEQESQKTANFSTDMFAFGGQLSYKDGGIHIKEANKGKFTAAAKRAGMGVQEYASKILAHKENYSSQLVKRANFAHNASKFKHADGGQIDANRMPQYFATGGEKQAFLDRAQDARIRVAYFDEGGTWRGAKYDPNYTPAFDFQANSGGDNTSSVMQNGVQNYVQSNPDTSFAQNQADVQNQNNTNTPSWWSKNKGTIGNIGTKAGMGAISNMGNLAYLHDQGKKYDRQSFYGYNPTTLDPTNALRDVNESTYSVRRAVPGMTSGSGSLAINALLANKLQGDMTKADVRQRYDEANASINNSGQQYNIGNRYRTDDINAANKGAAQRAYYEAIGRTGANTGQQLRDNRVYNDQKSADNMRMKTLEDLHSNWTFDKQSGHWIPKLK